MWNNVPNCRINLSATTGPTSVDIWITAADLAPGVCGEARFPMNGRAGTRIMIDVGEISGNSFAQRQRTIAHEIGHAIGFRHTNWQFWNEPQVRTDDVGAHADATHIMGTPTGNDPISLMNGRECGIGATTLSNFDILAVQFLYPENPPAAGTVPVFRYYNKAIQKHFYTPEYNELGDGNNDGFIFEGVGFFAFPNQVPNSVGVIRWYIPATGEHFYTTNPNEIPGGGVNEGIWFYAYPSAINGAVPVHRYYQSSISNHFYTKNQNEIPNGNGYEGVGWYAY